MQVAIINSEEERVTQLDPMFAALGLEPESSLRSRVENLNRELLKVA